jgi:hypothetical protein
LISEHFETVFFVVGVQDVTHPGGAEDSGVCDGFGIAAGFGGFLESAELYALIHAWRYFLSPGAAVS